MYYLYTITNGKSGKMYIGQTKNPNKRWKQHKSYAKKPEKTGQYIHRAMNKYGSDNFIFEIIAQCLTKENADIIEDILINQYDTRNKEKGYNIAAGGKVKEMTKERLIAILEGQKKWREKMKIENPNHPALGFQKGHKQVANSGSFKMGQHNKANEFGHKAKSNSGSFKKGHIPWNKKEHEGIK